MSPSASLSRRGGPSGRFAIRGGRATGSTHTGRNDGKTAHAKPLQAAKVGKLIIAIDLGTTRVFIATKEVLYTQQAGKNRKEDLKEFLHWPGSSMKAHMSPSTNLYYRPMIELPVMGHDLKGIHLEPDFEPRRHIRQLKMMFHDHQNDPTTLAMQMRTQKSLNFVGKTADSALHDLAQVILGILFGDQHGNGGGLRHVYDRLDLLDIELVLAVPPGRSIVDHARVREAFVQTPIKSNQVFMESEPAAMFRSWVNSRQISGDWGVGKTFIIVDMGGGTCCIVRMQLENVEPKLAFRQDFASQSLTYGAETISDAMVNLAREKVPQDWPQREQEIVWISDQFEELYKDSFGRKGLKDIQILKWGARDTYWQFSFDEVAGCFDICLAQIIKGINREMDRGPADYLILGGGLASNQYVIDKLTRTFRDITIRKLDVDKGHVAFGSVLARVDEDFIVDYPITRSKAVTTFYSVDADVIKLPFYKRLFSSTKRSPTDENILYFKGATWLAKKGSRGKSEHRAARGDGIEILRERHLNPNDKYPEFKETILTFNYDPRDDEFAFEIEDSIGDNDLYLDSQGLDIPAPENREDLTWSPWGPTVPHPGFEIDDLSDEEDAAGNKYKKLRYDIGEKLTETSTEYWANIRSSKTMKQKYGFGDIAFKSKPILQERVIVSENVSRSLVASYEIDNQKRIRKRPTQDPVVGSRPAVRRTMPMDIDDDDEIKDEDYEVEVEVPMPKRRLTSRSKSKKGIATPVRAPGPSGPVGSPITPSSSRPARNRTVTRKAAGMVHSSMIGDFDDDME